MVVGSDEKRRRLRELLVPDGEPVGEPGRRQRVRVVEGGLAAAREWFDSCLQIGEILELESYDGTMLDLGDGDKVGLRERSNSGEPTLDVNVKSVPEVTKVKFVG